MLPCSRHLPFSRPSSFTAPPLLSGYIRARSWCVSLLSHVCKHPTQRIFTVPIATHGSHTDAHAIAKLVILHLCREWSHKPSCISVVFFGSSSPCSIARLCHRPRHVARRNTWKCGDIKSRKDMPRSNYTGTATSTCGDRHLLRRSSQRKKSSTASMRHFSRAPCATVCTILADLPCKSHPPKFELSLRPHHTCAPYCRHSCWAAYSKRLV